ncbi:hypothetical protein GAYE_SCF12G3333 [Galdieria yellowstonensis]|uniref:Glucose-induced degradation protein 4 homolog n=1 Tax=Galdieria yellowstonensis TaxID=3028027 RepID=A0AAV9IDH7_9RHOD|nr:hypothetical protein GAYE_SCF12G3333 [Galdieria yellowstonensis]
MPATSLRQGCSPKPIFCSLLQAGQRFQGIQNSWKLVKDLDYWTVHVEIQDYIPEKGYICGTMEAIDVPRFDYPVITFWEGQIVDNIHYGFRTGCWEATEEDDLRHWSQFSAFRALERVFEIDRARQVALHPLEYVFMRWKERYFVNVPHNCGLTIAGFYYVCMNRITGETQGYYFDPDSLPFQKLQLSPCCLRGQGFTCPWYAFQ